ncbi:MAG TPA: fibrobacter succinogenes major paralogous domain-containing protein [Chitinophagales bacterium]|nr:fibrobacter succinogenes major paralogous domain-containing protein [Chitinophagales bacterium]
MKKSIPFFKSILFSVLILSLFTQCKKDSDDTKDPENPLKNEIIAEQNKRLEKVVKSATTTLFLHGNVLDEKGNPLSGVQVKVSDKTLTTNSEGYFVTEDAILKSEFAVVKAEKAGYMKGIRTFTPTAGAMNRIELVLQTKGTAQSLEVSKGGELSFDEGKVKLNFPAGSIADADGKAYTGSVKVSARYIDPELNDFASTMPGNLVGLTDGNNLVGMISYGMANVDLTDNSGNPLQVLVGKSVKVTMPAIKNAPADMPVWHFNETYGLWVESGKAIKESTTYSFEANHFSIWNLDTKVEDGVEKVTITIKSSTNQLIANQKVDIYTNDFSNFLRTVYTDDKGQFTLIRTPKNLGLRVITECQNIDKTVNIATENVIVTLPNLTGSAKVYQLSGTVKDCDINYANSYVTLQGLTEKKISFSGRTDADGKFETSVVLCDVNPSTKYQVQAMVFTGNGTVKIDTIEITFSGTTLQKDINFCDVVEVQNPYLNPDLTYGSVTDIEGNKYATIQIGTQIWMAENLRTNRLNDGTVIPNVTDNAAWGILTTGAWSYYENDTSYNTTYGKLYNWYAVNSAKLCPKGWHIPTDEDWSLIQSYLGSNSAGKMKATGNQDEGTGIWSAPNAGATNVSGFSALPGGSRFTNFNHINIYGLWWTSSVYKDDQALGRTMTYGLTDTKTGKYHITMGISCRCLKD